MPDQCDDYVETDASFSVTLSLEQFELLDAALELRVDDLQNQLDRKGRYRLTGSHRLVVSTDASRLRGIRAMIDRARIAAEQPAKEESSMAAEKGPLIDKADHHQNIANDAFNKGVEAREWGDQKAADTHQDRANNAQQASDNYRAAHETLKGQK